MARIPIPSEQDRTSEQQRVYDEIKAHSRDNRVGAPYQLGLHCPQFLEKWADVGRLLRYGTSLPPRLSELAILVTAHHWTCQYEWMAHEPHALKAQLPQSVVEAIRLGKRPVFADPTDEAVYLYCRQLHETHFVDDDTYERVLVKLGATGIVELTALVGHYAMIAMMLNANGYSVPPGAEESLPRFS